MLTKRGKHSQKAQGMVEFALVLPILLLVLFGIIAFGHLFFVYSFTVASSREAARWGAAVGIAGSGLPRYRDCAAIRSSAISTGRFVGVGANSVTIEFDHGPGTAVYATCPIGGEGPDVMLGDRIIVRVTVPYEPIVPFVNLPSFPMNGVTARTIIRSLPVGDAPTAESPCIKTVVVISPADSTLDVNTLEQFTYSVQARTGTTNPTSGSVSISIDGNKLTGFPKTALSGTFSHTFSSHGFHQISASFTSSDIHFCPSLTDPDPLSFWVRIDSKTTILSDDPDPSKPEDSFVVNVRVEEASGSTTLVPSGQVVVFDRDDPSVGCLVTLDDAGEGGCTMPTPYPYVGPRYLVARYSGDTNFMNSPNSGAVMHTIQGDPTPTLIVPVTVTPTNPPPPVCPQFIPGSKYNFTDQTDAFYVTVRNQDDNYTATLTSVEITWPPQPAGDAMLNQVRFASDTSGATCSGSSCLWTGSLDPKQPRLIGPSPNIFLSGVDTSLAPNATKQVRAVFSKALPDTNPSNKNETKYQMTLVFRINGVTCPLTLGPSERPN